MKKLINIVTLGDLARYNVKFQFWGQEFYISSLKRAMKL